MMSDAIRQTFLGLVEANKAQRTPAPLADLCVGLKCGGSDGFSGISANPAIGHTADLLAGSGRQNDSVGISGVVRRGTGTHQSRQEHRRSATGSFN